MRGKRARFLRHASLLFNADRAYRRAEDCVYQVQSGGAVKRVLGALVDALRKPKTYAVTGQIICPAAASYRRVKRAWVRRGGRA